MNTRGSPLDRHLFQRQISKAAIGRSLPAMAKKRTGRIRCKWLVRSNANGWSSLCNYPSTDQKNLARHEAYQIIGLTKAGTDQVIAEYPEN